MQRLLRSSRSVLGAAAIGSSLMMTGCGTGLTKGYPTAGAASPAPVIPTKTIAFEGKVQHGTQPVVGAQVSLYAAGSGGYGTAATALLPSADSVVTDAKGAFGIPTGYQCASADDQLYVIAKGGDTGGGVQPAAVLLATVGRCGDIAASTAVTVNEVTTVAGVYALQQFMTPGTTDISTSATNRQGLANAFRSAANLVDSSTGQARTTTVAGNGIVPQKTLHTLANILAACVGTRGTAGACATLFGAAVSSTGAPPSDTLAAALNIAQNPGAAQALGLFSLQAASPLFQPTLGSEPNDWTLSLEYSGGALDHPEMPAVDAEGNIWVPNAVDPGPGTLSEFSPAGAVLSPAEGYTGGGLNAPYAVAIDLRGNVWAANKRSSSVSQHASNGSPLSGSTGYTAAGLVEPNAIALDASGNVFTSNGNSSMTKLTSAGAAVVTATGGGLYKGYSVAVDAGQNIWVANSAGASVSKFTDEMTPASTVGFSGGGLNSPLWVALDRNGNAWLANADAAAVSVFSSAGTPISSAAGSAYATPASTNSLAVDGDNTVWTANSDGSISHLRADGTALSPAGGYTSTNATGELGVVIDGSGNVWTTDIYVNRIFEYVGVAAPVVTPLVKAVQAKQIGMRP